MKHTSDTAAGHRVGLEVRRILVPTDFSACARQAFRYAVGFAERHGAEIRLLHVLTVLGPERPAAGETGGSPAYAAELMERLTAEARKELAAAQTGLPRGVRIETVLRNSLATAQAILTEAETGKADLIVMGTHGRRGLKHVLLGSVAEEVVRRATVSTLTVHEAVPVDRPIRRILAPTDLSEHAAQAVQVAKALALRSGAALDLLHVVEPVPFPAAGSMGGHSFYEHLPAQRRQLLDALNGLAGGVAVPVTTHVIEGHAVPTIVNFARTHGSDLVVMSTRGLSGLTRFFIGSVTERVVRTTDCPVLTVRTTASPVKSVKYSQARRGGGDTMIDKPGINREEELLWDRQCHMVQQRLVRACALLQDREELGQPYRDGARLVIPIVEQEQRAQPDAGEEDVHALWLGLMV